MENSGFKERVTHTAGDEDGCTGGWKCSKCSSAIDRLPFKPDPGRLNQLVCLNCYKDRKRAAGY